MPINGADSSSPKAVCPECNGNRLNPISLHFFIDGKSIADVASMDIAELYKWTQGLENRLDPHRRVVAEEILKEIRSRLRFLLEVGLDYLSLNRSSSSLSGGRVSVSDSPPRLVRSL